jgi:hypothetical protein
VFMHSLDARRHKYKCMKCHDDGAFCAECHYVMRVTPTGHRSGDFLRKHGDNFISNPRKCALCHAQSSTVCLKCHSVVKP